MTSGVNVPLIELINAGIEDRNGVRQINGITFNVTRGEFVCLQGPTGSGKSLALNMIAGIKRPSFGQIFVAGDCINDFTERQMLFVRRSMGIMIQECLLLEDRTIAENIMLPALAAEASTEQARQQALAALSRCHMSDWALNYPIDLSSGQRQQVCLARAVVNQPVLILADEPAAHLDANNAQTVINLLGEFASAGVTVIVASHLLLAPRDIAYREVKFASQHGGL